MLSRRNFIKLLLGLGINVAILTVTDSPLKLINYYFKKITMDKNIEPPKSPKKIIKENLFNPMDDIKALTSIDMQGREAGSIGEGKAAEYLSNRLRNLGLLPIGQSEYQQIFIVPPMEKAFLNNRLVYIQGNKAALRTPCVNLLGKFPGKKKDENIVLCAHYDHMGIFNNSIYPGANDNASGVACVLTVLERLSKEGIHKGPNIIVAFWSGEEMGFLGSKAFVESPLVSLKQIKAVFNVDSIGNGPVNDFAYWSDYVNIAEKTLKNAAKYSNISIQRLIKNGHNSDNVSFSQVRIPAVTLISKEWLEKNHSVLDDEKIINPAKITKASDIIYRAIKLLS